MAEYLEPIKTAAAVFPFVALVMTVPFLLLEYHRYGAGSFFKAAVLYSFVLYLMCAYFLVILPLPERAAVAALTTPRCQWVPFEFLSDLVRENPFRLLQPATWLHGLFHRTVFVPLYNVLLTVPFGIYVRYYFRADKKRAVWLTFLLSLFFELTQLSGLYFIYPRSYRLFDVDDLLLNTLGGFLGSLLAPLAIKHLPTREEMNLRSRIRSRTVSGLRRTTALFLDAFLCAALTSVAELLLSQRVGFVNTASICFLIYYIALPFFFRGSTLAGRYLHLQVAVEGGEKRLLRLWRIALRVALFALCFLVLPVLLVMGALFLSAQQLPESVRGTLLFGYVAAVTAVYLCAGVKFLFTERPMLYERWSRTRLESTTEAAEAERNRRKRLAADAAGMPERAGLAAAPDAAAARGEALPAAPAEAGGGMAASACAAPESAPPMGQDNAPCAAPESPLPVERESGSCAAPDAASAPEAPASAPQAGEGGK